MAFPTLKTDLFDELASEFKGKKPAIKTLIAAEAAKCISEDKFGDSAEIAQVYLTAHMFEMSKRAGVGGMISSEKVGDLARSYAPISGHDSVYNDTSYGREFIRIRRKLVCSPQISSC